MKRQLWVFIFCAQNIFAYNKYFPKRAMISRLATRGCVSGYTDWVFIEMWSMTNPFSSILATSPEPELFRPLSDAPLYTENQRGFKTVFYSSRVKYECTLSRWKPQVWLTWHPTRNPSQFTQISPVDFIWRQICIVCPWFCAKFILNKSCSNPIYDLANFRLFFTFWPGIGCR